MRLSEKIDAVHAARRDNRLDDARSLAAAALAAARADGSGDDLVRAHGQIERDAGRPQDALASYQEAVAILADTGPATVHAHALRHVGELHLTLDDVDGARSALRSALDFYDAYAGDADADDVTPLDHANALRAYALLQERLGDDADARSAWARARGLYEACGVAEGVGECDLRLGLVGSGG